MSKPVQLQIDMFLQNNEQELVDIQESNPELYYNVFQVLDFINARFGRGEKIPRVVAKKEESKQPEVVTVDSHTGEVSTKSEENLFQVGDIFVSVLNGEGYSIQEISLNDARVKSIKRGKETNMPIKDINDLIRNEVWEKSQFTAAPTAAQPVNMLFEVGDFFKIKDSDWEYVIESVSEDGNVSIKDSSNVQSSLPVDLVNMRFKDGTFTKIAKPAPVAQPDLPAAGSATTEPEAVMTIQELKDAISGLKLIADFDEEAAQELKRLQNELKQLKKKKA